MHLCNWYRAKEPTLPFPSPLPTPPPLNLKWIFSDKLRQCVTQKSRLKCVSRYLSPPLSDGNKTVHSTNYNEVVSSFEGSSINDVTNILIAFISLIRFHIVRPYSTSVSSFKNPTASSNKNVSKCHLNNFSVFYRIGS